MPKKTTRPTGTVAPRKGYGRMTADELAAATAEYDAETPDGPKVLPAPAAARAKLAAAMAARPGRPVVGEGAERINVTVERALLKAADDYADAHGMSRSELIAAGLRLAMGPAKAPR